jgi:hypothetical protein
MYIILVIICKQEEKMKKILILLGFLLFGLLNISYAGYIQSWKVSYSSVTERAEAVLKGDMYISASTNTADADVVFKSGGTNPLQLYDGDLRIVTTGYGITFADGSLQITAGVGSAFDTLSSTGTIVINSDSDNSGGESIFLRTAGATERMRIDGSTGNIGIGITNPVNKLEINGDVSLQNNQGISARNSALTIGNLIKRDSSDQTVVGHLFDNPMILQTGQSYLVFKTSSTERMRLDINGNVGIGTNNPQADLQIKSAEIDYNTSNYRLDISTDINMAGDIYTSGNIGVGTLSPSEQVEVNGDIKSSRIMVNDGSNLEPTFTFSDNLATGTGMYSPAQNTVAFAANDVKALQIETNATYFRDGSESAPAITFFNDQNTGMYRIGNNIIGITTNGTKDMEIDGTQISILPLLELVTVPPLSSGYNDLIINNTTNIVSYLTSSSRYKTNITTMTSLTSDWIYDLRPVTFNALEGYGNTDIINYGLIAEEVEIINPDICGYIKDENNDLTVNSVTYSQLTIPMLFQVQELKKKIDILEIEIEQLKAN